MKPAGTQTRMPLPVVPVAAFLLALSGLLTIMSAQSGSDAPFFFAARQLGFMLLGLLTMAIAARIPFDVHCRTLLPFYAGISLLALLLLPLLGVKINGMRGWYGFAGMLVQPSELSKGIFLLLLAVIAARPRPEPRRFGWMAAAALLFAGPVMLQPDFGTAALSGIVGFSLMFLASVRLAYILPTAGVGVVGFFTLVFFDPVRWQRITSFWDVEANRAGTAYQLYQGLVAYGVGGVDGVGLGQGRQQMAFLPEAHTDFIFPIVGEELGMVCTIGVVAVFLILFLTVASQLRRAPNLFQFSLCTGALLCIVLQAAINIGVVTGMLPTKGMSLPFISYGGSNLVLMFILIGVIVNCLRQWSRPAAIRAREL